MIIVLHALLKSCMKLLVELICMIDLMHNDVVLELERTIKI